jgi:hypothetical protein
VEPAEELGPGVPLGGVLADGLGGKEVAGDANADASAAATGDAIAPGSRAAGR